MMGCKLPSMAGIIRSQLSYKSLKNLHEGRRGRQWKGTPHLCGSVKKGFSVNHPEPGRNLSGPSRSVAQTCCPLCGGRGCSSSSSCFPKLQEDLQCDSVPRERMLSGDQSRDTRPSPLGPWTENLILSAINGLAVSFKRIRAFEVICFVSIL